MQIRRQLPVRGGLRGLLVLSCLAGVCATAATGGGAIVAGSVSGWVITDLEAGSNVSHLWATDAIAVNEGGQIIGGGADSAGEYGRAFVWQNGKMTDLGTLGGSSSTPTAINDRGQVVGWSNTESGARHAFLWQQGRMRDLGTLPGKRASEAVAINARGQIIGDSYAKLDRDGLETAPRAFLWQNGKMTDLGTLGASSSKATVINVRGQIIGVTLATDSQGRTVRKAFLWQSEKMSYLPVPRGSESVASATNDRGQIVGSAGGAGTMEPFLWENGKMTALGVFDVGGRDPEANALALNERDQIVGTSHAMMASQHATLWTKQK